MGNSFRADDLNQSLLFPPSLHDWLPDNHLARFLANVVLALDLEAIYCVFSAEVRMSEAVALGDPVLPVFYGLSG
jgi:hypothetical protein